MSDMADERSDRDRAFDTHGVLFTVPFGVGVVMQMVTAPDAAPWAGWDAGGLVVGLLLSGGYAVTRYWRAHT